MTETKPCNCRVDVGHVCHSSACVPVCDYHEFDCPARGKAEAPPVLRERGPSVAKRYPPESMTLSGNIGNGQLVTVSDREIKAEIEQLRKVLARRKAREGAK